MDGHVEDCVCNSGYLRDGDNCVRRSQCGCSLDGVYVSKGTKTEVADWWKLYSNFGSHKIVRSVLHLN